MGRSHRPPRPRRPLPDAVDLAVAIGGAGEAGIELVHDSYANAALLLDPDTHVLIPDPTAAADESARQMLHQPEVADKLERFFGTLDSDMLDEFALMGTLPPEGIEMLVDASLDMEDDLPHDQKQLVRQMMIEQMAATLPLDTPIGQHLRSDRPGWITRLGPVAERCTIAITNNPLYRLYDFDAVLRTRAPGTQLIHLTDPASAWITAPHELTALIRRLLWQDQR